MGGGRKKWSLKAVVKRGIRENLEEETLLNLTWALSFSCGRQKEKTFVSRH